MTTLTDQARAELLGDLALLTRAEPERFVSALLVAPTTDDFPDDWVRSEEGLRAIGDRLLAYAGLDGYSLEIALDDHAVDETSLLPATDAVLAGIEGRVVHVSVTRVGRHEDAVFALTFEIARAARLVRALGVGQGAYRETQRDDTQFIEAAETKDELYRASILAVHLGLGLVGVHGAHAYRQTGSLFGSRKQSAWRHLKYGALGPEEASYLLAVQLAVRAPDEQAIHDLLARLPDERRMEVTREMALLDRPQLLATLGLPPIETWPAPLERAPPSRTPRRRRKKEPKKPREVGFRVQRFERGATGCLGFVVGVVLLVFFVWLGAVLSVPVVLGALWIPTAIGWWAGRWRVSYECSECERRVPANADACGRCSHRLVGEIELRSQRFGARSRWTKSQREARVE